MKRCDQVLLRIIETTDESERGAIVSLNLGEITALLLQVLYVLHGILLGAQGRAISPLQREQTRHAIGSLGNQGLVPGIPRDLQPMEVIVQRLINLAHA